MDKKFRIWFLRYRWMSMTVLLLFGLFLFTGCGSSDSPVSTGIFVDSPVAGLNYTGLTTVSATTTANGSFIYRSGETITFSIGNLTLGSAIGAAQLTPLAVTSGAMSASDQKVNNKLILLQTLDADGDLNNGIQITEAIRAIVSANAASINFDQTTTAFQASLAGLMTALNNANVFTDTDPRVRTVRTATAALEHFERSISVRHVVNTAYGQVSGYEANATTKQFLGIPYAKPPIGDLRWKPPQAPTPWTGVRQAIAWSDQAAQNPLLQRFGEGGMSEDCLYLNVTAPKNASNLPVMVWFHGGGFTSLTSNTKPFNNPLALVTKGVVQVSVNHRLGPFGYIAHPQLSAESGYNGSGNYGQMDLMMALNWVKNNIANFGGNPNNVTIFGESGGGRKVLSLMASPQAAGLFHKAISQSGTLYSTTRTLADAEAVGTALSTKLGVTTLAQMRAKSWTDIVTAASTLTPYTNIDNYYYPYSEQQSFETRRHNDVPFMIVVNTNDNIDPIGTWKNVFPWMTDYSSQNHYACLFSRVPNGWMSMGLLTYHGLELAYVFNYPESIVTHYLLGLVLDPVTGRSLVIGDLNGNGVTGSAGDTADIYASAGWSSADSIVADTVMIVWTNFAKTGNPSTTNFTWPVYTKANDTYVELNTSFTVKTGQSTLSFPVFP